MADWNKPDLQSQYTQVLTELDGRLDDSAKFFDGVTTTNIPDGTKRWNPSSNVFEEWDQTAGTWGPLILAVDGGGTGSDTATGARSNLGLGTAATRDVGVSTNAQIPDRGQADIRYGQKTVNESVSGTWDFTNGLNINSTAIAQAAFRDVGEAAGNVMEVGAFSGPTGTQTFLTSPDLYVNGGTILETSSLAANGGTIPEVNQNNTFINPQSIQNDNGLLLYSSNGGDQHRLRTSGFNKVQLVNWTTGNKIEFMGASGDLRINDGNLLAYNRVGVSRTSAGNAATSLDQLVVGDGGGSRGMVISVGLGNLGRYAFEQGGLLQAYIEYDNSNDRINFKSAARYTFDNLVEVPSLQVGGGATITKVLKASVSLPSGTWTENQEVVDASVSGANVGDSVIVNARDSNDPTNAALPIVGSVVRSGVVQVTAVGSVGSDGSEDVEIMVFQN